MLNINVTSMFSRVLIATLLAVMLTACAVDQSKAPKYQAQVVGSNSSKACVLIDTDFDTDDMMAIPLVITNKNVAAIIMTEGVSLAPQGASALSRFIAEPGAEPGVPVIIGANFPSKRDVSKWPWLLPKRAIMHQANRLLSAPLNPTVQVTPYALAVKNNLDDCKIVSILILGPFTSFVKYSPEIKEKIDLVVMQGRPRFVADASIEPKISFNCEYDLEACEKAFDQLKGLNAVWVDVPEKMDPPYIPTLAMVEGLDPTGLSGTLKQALIGNQLTWNQSVMPNDYPLLWDQLAAQFLIYPELYKMVPGGFMEPFASALEMQLLWTKSTNKKMSVRP